MYLQDCHSLRLLLEPCPVNMSVKPLIIRSTSTSMRRKIKSLAGRKDAMSSPRTYAFRALARFALAFFSQL